VAYVRSVLENCSSVWSPCFAVHSDSIEKVQRRFISYIASKMNVTYDHISHEQITSILRLGDLEDRRKTADALFIYKLINGLIDCPDILKLLNFRVPAKILRSNLMFSPDTHRSVYGTNSPVDRMMSICNSLDIDFFHVSLATLKRYLHSLRGDVV
jgi:hypothetical protein